MKKEVRKKSQKKRERENESEKGRKGYDSLSHPELEALEVGHLCTLLASLESLRPRSLLPLLHDLALWRREREPMSESKPRLCRKMAKGDTRTRDE